MILALNTAQKTHEMALIDGEGNEVEILAERTWPNRKNDVEELVPNLQKMLEELGLEKTEIKEILVITGPGPYTAVRTGVTFANALAEGLGAKLYTMNTYELLKRKAATNQPIIVVTNAGGLDVGVQEGEDQVKVGPMAELLAEFEHDKYLVVSEVTQAQKTELHGICLEKGWKEVEGEKLQTLGETILTFGFKGLKPVDIAEVFYLKDPVITKSQDPWKNR